MKLGLWCGSEQLVLLRDCGRGLSPQNYSGRSVRQEKQPSSKVDRGSETALNSFQCPDHTWHHMVYGRRCGEKERTTLTGVGWNLTKKADTHSWGGPHRMQT